MKTQITLFRSTLLLLSLALTLGFSHSALSAETDHPALIDIKKATYNMIEALKTASKEQRGSPSYMRDVVTQHLSPRIDFIASSRWVLGKYWRKASLDEKKSFILEFRKLLIQFYSTALSEYAVNNDIDHGVLTYLPVRNDAKDEDITIHSRVNTPSGKTIPVKYHAHLTKKGWKIYDVSVEGVSMITTYRSSFASELRQKGVNGIITSLKERNAKLAASTNTPKLAENN